MGSTPLRTRIKICGITRTDDATAAAKAGADAIGLVFYPPSPRFLSVERAREIRDALPPFVQTVALFVNADAAQVAQVIGRVHPAMLQFHGDEPPQLCAQFGLPYVKACRVKAGVDALEYLRPFSRPGAWTYRAASSRRKASRTARRSPLSSQRSGMRMYDMPDAGGHFGPYGGVFVAETLTAALDELRAAYAAARRDPAFEAEFRHELKHYVGRPSPIYPAKRLSEKCRGAQIYLKREDLNHTGAHKINNTVGQALLARRMGKPRVIAETGAGMHGVAAATVAARYGMECVVYMGAEDIKRQVANVYRMKLLGATVVPVDSGSKTLKDALNEAMRDWVTNVDGTFYILGTVAG